MADDDEEDDDDDDYDYYNDDNGQSLFFGQKNWISDEVKAEKITRV